jgi:hypothetical protein
MDSCVVCCWFAISIRCINETSQSAGFVADLSHEIGKLVTRGDASRACGIQHRDFVFGRHISIFLCVVLQSLAGTVSGSKLLIETMPKSF